MNLINYFLGTLKRVKKNLVGREVPIGPYEDYCERNFAREVAAQKYLDEIEKSFREEQKAKIAINTRIYYNRSFVRDLIKNSPESFGLERAV